MAQDVAHRGKRPDLAAPTVTLAMSGIFTAFQTYPLVGVGDWHGMAQEEDFYGALIRDSRFAKEVGNVVVEFGDAAQQDTIDRYVSGEDVPYPELRKVWADTVGWIPTVTALGYLNFYAQVRAVNLTLEPAKRIRVWLGDPPVDWSKINSEVDIANLPSRDGYAADLINSQVLAKHKKALVIYGTFHFYGSGSMRMLVEHDHPGAFFIVTPYIGFTDRGCAKRFEMTVRNWPSEALATPVRSSFLEEEMHAPGCQVVDAAAFAYAPGKLDTAKVKGLTEMRDQLPGVSGDALLYLGPAVSLTYSPLSPDLYLDADFRRESIGEWVFMDKDWQGRL